MFLDAAYVVKYYVNEADSSAVRRIVRTADSLTTSVWSIVEVASAIRRHFREGRLNAAELQASIGEFRTDVEGGTWTLVPADEPLFWRLASRIAALPAGVFLRAGDAIQLASAAECGENEIWSNDRHLLAAAPHFGLTGRSA